MSDQHFMTDRPLADEKPDRTGSRVADVGVSAVPGDADRNGK
jgi:hypothetical protein